MSSKNGQAVSSIHLLFSKGRVISAKLQGTYCDPSSHCANFCADEELCSENISAIFCAHNICKGTGKSRSVMSALFSIFIIILPVTDRKHCKIPLLNFISQLILLLISYSFRSHPTINFNIQAEG